MTPKELAEKIERIFPPALPDELRKEFITTVESLLSSALEEAQFKVLFKVLEQNEVIVQVRLADARAAGYAEGALCGVKREEERWVKRGMKEAYEECAKLAEAEDDPGPEDYCGSSIAEKIRAKVAEVK